MLSKGLVSLDFEGCCGLDFRGGHLEQSVEVEIWKGQRMLNGVICVINSSQPCIIGDGCFKKAGIT